jgi:prolyl oligopeptidase
MVFGAGKGLHVRASVDENDASRVQAGASAVAHLRGNSQISYPAVVLTTGINDPRVDPWQAAKMAARLQAATSSGKPILLRIDYDAGHGIGSGKAQRIQELADEISFAFWQFGDPQFRAAAWNAPAPNNGHPRGENIRGQIR